MWKLINICLKPQRSRGREREINRILQWEENLPFSISPQYCSILYVFNFLYQFHIIISCFINVATTPVTVVFWSPFHIFVSQRQFCLQFCAFPPSASLSPFIIPPRSFHEISPHLKPPISIRLACKSLAISPAVPPLQIHSKTTPAVTNPHHKLWRSPGLVSKGCNTERNILRDTEIDPSAARDFKRYTAILLKP